MSPRPSIVGLDWSPQAEAHIEEHLDARLSLEQMAAVVGLNPYHFARQFKAATGLPPHQYVIVRRVERAKGLLQAGAAVSLAEATRNPVAFGLGEIAGLVEYGASPRGPISLVQSARALALIHGRDYVLGTDVRSLARDALRHRLVLTYRALAEQRTADDVLEAVLGAVAAPALELGRPVAA